MGCPICLDAFGEDNERGTRPVALPCGHIFHKACSDAWLKACRTKDDPVGCPLCKRLLGDQHALPLWPSDLNDLDYYMQSRNRRMDIQRDHDDKGKPLPAAQALDRYMARDAQANLLGKLLDFRQHINAYVMAINNVSMSTSFGDRIFRLFMDTTKNTTAKDQLTASMKALTEATAMMDETVASLETLRRATEEKQRRANDNLVKSEAMRKSWHKHMETKAHEEQRMLTESTRASTLRVHLKKELQEVERRKQAMEKEREAFVRDAREKAADAMRARVESAHMIAQSKGDADVKLAELNKYVQEQERLRIIAEDRSREARSRSNWLADRNKLLSHKLDAARAEVKKLKGAIEQGQSSVGHIDVKGKGKGRADEGELTPKEEQTDHQGLENGDQSNSSSQEAESSSRQLDELRHTLSQERFDDDGTSPVNARDTVVIEDDDLDGELNDESYPMPFGRSFSGGGVWSGPAGGVLLPGVASSASRAREEDDGDDSIEFVDIKRRRPNTRSQGQSSSALAAEQPQSGTSNMLSSNAMLMQRMFNGHNPLWSAPTRRRR